MSRRISISIIFLLACFTGTAQVCNDTIASGCYCTDTLQTNCDLLPDISIAVKATADSGRYIEYPQFNAGENSPGQGSDDGRFRLGISTPNIGAGPLHVTTVNLYLCGTDTFSSYPGACPDGREPLQLIQQRIYHKNGAAMTYSERLAGYTFFHPVHNHVHVEDWCAYSLRIKDPDEPDPLKWPLLGEQGKTGFCLYNFGTCSGDTGYCRDKKDSILFDQDFKNFNLGSYVWCDPKVQGISPGHYDYYYKEIQGMWIDIPTGTCNGNYYVVIHVDPYNRYKESDETNNVAAIPVTLSKQEGPGNPVAQVFPGGNTVICEGDSVLLFATAGFSYTWSTGDSAAVIYAKNTGKYAVKVNSPCGVSVSDSIEVQVLSKPAAPLLEGDSLCKYDAAFLKASGTADYFYWYNKPSGGIPLDTGAMYQTPALTATTQYYTEAVDTCRGLVFRVGKTDSSGRGKYVAGGKHLVFDCLSPFTLMSFTLYSKYSGISTVELRDQYGTNMQSTLINFTAGENRILLNMDIKAGKSQQIFFTGTDDSLFINDTLAGYPFAVPGVVSIKNSSLSKKEYVFFYDWEIKAADIYCHSKRIPVTAYVDSTCISSLGERSNFKNNFRVYQDENAVHFSIKKYQPGNTYEMQLYDITGRMVWKDFFAESSLTVSKFFLKGGVYIYQVRDMRLNTKMNGKVILIRNR